MDKIEYTEDNVIKVRVNNGKIEYAKKVITKIYNSIHRDYEIENVQIKWFKA